MPAKQTPTKKRKIKLVKSPKPVPACSVCGATENIIPDESLCYGACDENPASRLYEEEEGHTHGGGVCCVGCGEVVCDFHDEPPHKDRKGEAVCDECWVGSDSEDEEEEEEEYPKKEYDDQGIACWQCRDCDGWNDWDMPCGHCQVRTPGTPSCSDEDSESEPDEEEEKKHNWEDIKRYIVDEYDRGWVVEYPGGDRQKILKKQVIGKPRFAQPSVTLSVTGEAEAKKEQMKHPAPAIKCPTMTLKEEAEKKGYKIYFSADKKHKQQYANQQRALGLIRKGKKSWDDYDHDWLSTKQTKARRTIDEVDKLRDEVAELKALVKTLMAKLG